MNPNDPYNQQPQYNPYGQQQQPQQGYGQQQPYGYGQQPMMNQQPKRSAIPKVIGILMIIFGGIGLLGGLFSLVTSSAMSQMADFSRHSYGSYGGGLYGSSGSDSDFHMLSTFATFSKITTVFGLLIAGLEMFAGISLVGYKAKGIAMAKTYAIVNMVTSVLSLILVYAWMKPAMDRVGMGGVIGAAMVFGTFIALAWPTVVLVLVTRPAAKAACTNF